jgi:UDP-N-acetyl-2-amino-2-deoxyglucuronate dehydrogenase
VQHAIIGCGRVAPNHVDAFRHVPGWELAAACDIAPGLAEGFARTYSIPRAVDRLDALFSDPSIASVSVTVDHASHDGIVKAALRAGKHVLVEKPFGLDAPRARELTRVAASCGLTLAAVAQHRYDPVVRAVGDWITHGLLGDVVCVEATLSAHRDADYYTGSYWRGTQAGEGGSALINQGFHCLDTVRWLCGDLTVRSALARTTALRGVIETEDTICGVLTTRDDAVVQLSVTVASNIEWRTRIEVVGTAGSVRFDLDHPGRLHFWHGGPELIAAAELVNALNLGEEPPGPAYYGVSHRRQVADFCRAIDIGAPMLFSATDHIGTLETITALYAAARAER